MEEAAAAHLVASEGAAARHAGEEAAWRRREAALLHRTHHLEGQLAAESQVGASTPPVALAAPALGQSSPSPSFSLPSGAVGPRVCAVCRHSPQ